MLASSSRYLIFIVCLRNSLKTSYIVNCDKVESALIQFLLIFLVEEEEKRQTGGLGGSKPRVSKCQMFLINQKAVSSVIYTQGFSIL